MFIIIIFIISIINFIFDILLNLNFLLFFHFLKTQNQLIIIINSLSNFIIRFEFNSFIGLYYLYINLTINYLMFFYLYLIKFNIILIVFIKIIFYDFLFNFKYSIFNFLNHIFYILYL